MSKLSSWLRMNKWKVILEKQDDLGNWIEVEEIDNRKTWLGLIWYLLKNKTDNRVVLYRDWIGE